MWQHLCRADAVCICREAARSSRRLCHDHVFAYTITSWGMTGALQHGLQRQQKARRTRGLGGMKNGPGRVFAGGRHSQEKGVGT